AAYYRYDSGDGSDPAVPSGAGYYVLAGYLLPFQLGPGTLQIAARHQLYVPASLASQHERGDALINYFVNGHFLRFAFDGYIDDAATGPRTYVAKVGAQLIL